VLPAVLSEHQSHRGRDASLPIVVRTPRLVIWAQKNARIAVKRNQKNRASGDELNPAAAITDFAVSV